MDKANSYLFRRWQGNRAKALPVYPSQSLTPEEIWDKLWVFGWGYNTLSHTYKGQIYTVRKVVPPRHKYHLRFYKNGDVSGHYEVDNLQFPLEHLDGVDLRPLNNEEIAALKVELGVE